jgi:hypothetical protein
LVAGRKGWGDIGAIKEWLEGVWNDDLPKRLGHMQNLFIEAAKEIRDATARAVDARAELVTYDHILQALRTEILGLEELAVVAYLDGVEWRLPHGDGDAVEVLAGVADSRVVKPVGGGVEGWGERWMMYSGNGRKDGDGAEWIDRLDVVEDSV